MRRRYVRSSVNSKKEETSKSIITDATLIIACITGLGYWIAYSYEKGYKSYYQLNELFIADIGIKDILISITAIFTLFLVIQQAFYIYNQWIPKTSVNPIVTAFKYKFTPTASLLLLLTLIIPSDKYNFLTYLFIAWFLVATWIFFIIPYLYHWKVKGYKNKMQQSVSKLDTSPMIQRLKKTYSWDKPGFIFINTVAVFMLTNVADSYGFRQASMQEHYFVIHQRDHDYVVLDNNGGNYILAPVNIKKAEMEPKFLIIEGKSSLSKPIIFKSVYFKDGLKTVN